MKPAFKCCLQFQRAALRVGDDAAGTPMFPQSAVLHSYRIAREHLEEVHGVFEGVARLREEDEVRAAAEAEAAAAEAIEDAEAEAAANAQAVEEAAAEAGTVAAAEAAEAEAEAELEAGAEAKVEVEAAAEMVVRNTSTEVPTSRGAASFLSPPAGITVRRMTRSRRGSDPLIEGLESDATLSMAPTTAPPPLLPPRPPGSAGGLFSPTMQRLRSVGTGVGGAGGAGGSKGDKRVSFDVHMASNDNDVAGGGESGGRGPAIATPAEETEQGMTRKRLRSSSFGGLK